MTHQLPKVHGHRGARGNRPENTIEATEFALQSGVDAIEVDLCVSKDNVVMVHHDLYLSPHLTRDIHGNWVTDSIPIISLDQTALQQFDVGTLRADSDYARRFPHQVAHSPARIPTLDEFIEYVVKSSHPDCVLNLELKGEPDHPTLLPDIETYTQLVLTAIDRHQIQNRCFVQSFDWRLIKIINELNSTILTGLLTDQQTDAHPRFPLPGESSQWVDNMDVADFDGSVPAMVAAAGSRVWSSHYKDLSPGLISAAHDLGLEVYGWTVNDTEDIQKMIDWGVDVITTDYPVKAVQLINKIRN